MNIFVAIVSISSLFTLLNIFSFAVEGQIGLAATLLNGTIDDTQTTVIVDSTTGFSATPGSYFVIEQENFCYASLTATTFVNIDRGCNNTTPKSHVSGRKVYNEGTSIINGMVGFNVAEAMSTAGPIRVPFMMATTIPRSFAKMVMWDYNYLSGDLWGLSLPLIKYVLLYPISAGFIIGLVVMLINVFMGVARLFT